MRNIYSIFTVTALISIDQLTKYLIRTSDGFYICNRGIAFGLPLILSISLFFGLLLIFFAFNFKFKIFNLKSTSNFKFQISNYSLIQVVGFILIFAGAISNIFDRLFFGCVIDFIDLGFWPVSIAMRSIAGWPVFNLADVYITIGAFIVIIKLLTENKDK